jgi:hypothetical protein
MFENEDFEIHEWYYDIVNRNEMWLSPEYFEKVALKKLRKLNRKVNELFVTFNIPLKNKVYINWDGKHYLFGKEIGSSSNSIKLTKIIEQTPKEQWNWHAQISGAWQKEKYVPLPPNNNLKSLFDDDD